MPEHEHRLVHRGRRMQIKCSCGWKTKVMFYSMAGYQRLFKEFQLHRRKTA